MEGVNSFEGTCSNTSESTEEKSYAIEDVDEDSSSVVAPTEANEVCKFFLEDKCRFGNQCRNRHEGEPVQKASTKPKSKQKKSCEAQYEKNKKKPPMKTADDVIKRLQWDPKLPKEYFVIGYLDRFLGVVEENFTTFSWENLASVDYDVLAIPQHRIQYFK